MQHLEISSLRAGFATPPEGYGEVPFYWWVGEKLTKERLLWQLDQLASTKPCGLQVNYAHNDRDGYSYGLSMPSEPPLFSDDWWELFLWWAQECNQRGIAVSLSDYTLGVVGQGWWMDEILAVAPAMAGRALAHRRYTASAGTTLREPLPGNLLAVRAYAPDEEVDLAAFVADGVLAWTPERGEWTVAAVYFEVNPHSVDPLHPQLGAMIIERFFQRFADRLPGQAGTGLNYFFSDELNFGIDGLLWTDGFAAAFRQKKGYDLLPLLPGLFCDIGRLTVKVRLDYYDVMLDLTEAGYFKPVFAWHEERGMTYGCDHGGRGRNVMEFGDYFRTQRWMSGPGCDQPYLDDNVIKNKVASSIAHLYGRPRVWLEGYHSSGWGTSSGGLTRATFENFVAGQNLLSLHGLYYSTLGGWWEWAPPCNHFRMPYWAHMPHWMEWLRRISFLLCQGAHRCDIAVLYPVAPAQAGMGAQDAVRVAFDAGTALFERGIDFDFIDDDSLARCTVTDGALCVAEEEYRVLLLPALQAARFSTLAKAAEFASGGGLVIALGALPLASDRAGAQDAELDALVTELFLAPQCRGVCLPDTDDDALAHVITRTVVRDFIPDAPCRVHHRRIGAQDLFLVTHAEAGTVCAFRANGRAELWDPWTGRSRALAADAGGDGYMRLRLPLSREEAQFIVFTQDGAADTPIAPTRVKCGATALGGEWEFELKPTMDNRWGDFRLPAFSGMIGAEARRFEYGEGASAEEVGMWRKVTYGFAPYFKQSGPLPEGEEPRAWRDYAFSWREGAEGDPGHQGWHGLKGQVTDEFLVWGKRVQRGTEFVYEPQQSPQECHYFRTNVISGCAQAARFVVRGAAPDQVCVNGDIVDDFDAPVQLHAGANALMLRYRGGGRGCVVLIALDAPSEYVQSIPLAMNWYRRPGVLAFDARDPDTGAGWYRFTAPPGLSALRFPALVELSVWVEGKPVAMVDGVARLDAAIMQPAQVLVRAQRMPGVYGGAVFAEPVAVECMSGLLAAGDWAKAGILENYSGGAWYRRNVTIAAEQLRGEVQLDLGDVVSSAEVWVNGRQVGIRLAAPWTFDITPFVQVGENRLEVLVYNTLANHYLTIPTRYRGELTSGLLGPVTLHYFV